MVCGDLTRTNFRGMRAYLIRAAFVLPCALGGCGVLNAKPTCRAEADRTIIWSNDSAPDRLVMRANGPECASAAIDAIVTNAAGVELLRAEALGHAMAGHGDNMPSTLPPVSDAKMIEYVDSLARTARLHKASELPAWDPGMPHLPRAEVGASYEAELPREAYEDLRARDVRVLCFDTGPETATCYAYDPVGGRAIVIAAHGV